MKSDKRARLYMCVDSNLLATADKAAKESGLSLEDKVEQTLYQAVKRRLKLFELFSQLTTEQRIFVLGYAKGLSDESVRPATLGRVAKALGVDPEEIVDDDAV